MENMVNVYFYGKKYSVPADLTIMTAMEYAGYTLTRGCGCCTVRCPAVISHAMVALLARRLVGKYVAPESEHLKNRVEEINEGEFDALIEQIMQKPIAEMKELYNNREIEK